MSTWTSRVLLLAAALGLAACDGGEFGEMAWPGGLVSRAAPQKIAVAGGDVVIAGPRGYCIDRSASREDGGGAFVLLGSCASLGNSPRLPHPEVPGLLTVTVSSGATEGEDFDAILSGLEAFFQSPDGRAALSRSGRAEAVKIVGTGIREDVLYVHAQETGSGPAEIAPDTWRALMGVNGRLVTVSVVGFEAVPMSRRDGLATLGALIRRILEENRV